MPRNEGFLDPAAGPLASFASDLRALREKAGRVPYRVLAKRAGFCASTLSVAASGARLPSLDVTLAYVQACGGDPEAWQARWHVLVAQLPPAHPGPSAQSGLQVAPPYDADEHGEAEPARSDAAARYLPPGGSRPTDHKMLESADHPFDTAHDGAQLESVTRVLETTSPAPTARAELGELSRSPRWRSRLPAVPISRVATVALTLATAILGLRMVVSEGAGNTPATSLPLSSASPAADTAMQQADALYTLIYQITPWRSDTNDTIWDLNGCRNLSNAQSKLRAIARKRQEQVEQLAALNVSKLPGNTRLVAALRHAWITSAQSDTAYANIAADLESGCTSGAITTDPNYQQADAYAQAAAAAKAEAAQLWNANADGLGQLWIKGAEL